MDLVFENGEALMLLCAVDLSGGHCSITLPNCRVYGRYAKCFVND